MPLSDAAKAEIAAAVAIVRADKFESHVRKTLGNYAPKKEVDTEVDELLTKEEEKVDPPPTKEKEVKTEEEKRRSAWWGEIEG